MRVLDLGAHDGYIANWLGRQEPLHIDGIELNPEACRVANYRAQRDSIPGLFKVGLAEDAPSLFEPASYDAVVAFELIEHVTDVPAFLDACETMCAPGGRVYVSTPDGTFGEGNNPHHLRTFRSIDLADLLRRRGRLEDMLSGPDGVVVASYSPDPLDTAQHSGEVAIYCGPGWQPWQPMDIEMKGLGGSETAAVRLADALSDLGYTVTVYGEVNEGVFRQVIYRRYDVFDPTVERKAVICSRIPALFDRHINARAKLLWMHDTDYGPELTEERASKIDQVMVLSDWHRGHVLSTYPFLQNQWKVKVTGNGIEPGYYTENGVERDQSAALYSSSPDRGLDLLLEWWPEVRKQVPDATLFYCYSDVYDAVARQQARNAGQRQLLDFRQRIEKMSEQDGVVKLGSLPQQLLAKQMMSVKAWLHPSYCSNVGQPFFETYCIGALEAAAAGCVRVGSDWGGLPEREPEYLVPPCGDGRPDKDLFIAAIVQALKAQPDESAVKAALATTWAKVAGDFAAGIER